MFGLLSIDLHRIFSYQLRLINYDSHAWNANIHKQKNQKNLQQLGKVALDGLLHDSRKLVFKKEDFKDIVNVYQISLKLGILSSTTIPLKHIRGQEIKNTTVEFFHKWEQEYCASLYLTSQDAGTTAEKSQAMSESSALQRVLSKIDCAEKMLECENVLRLAAGANGSICQAILTHLCCLKWDVRRNVGKCRMVLECLTEADPNSIESLTGTLKDCFKEGDLSMPSPTDCMITGLDRLPQTVKSKVLRFSYSSMSIYLHAPGVFILFVTDLSVMVAIMVYENCFYWSSLTRNESNMKSELAVVVDVVVDVALVVIVDSMTCCGCHILDKYRFVLTKTPATLEECPITDLWRRRKSGFQ